MPKKVKNVFKNHMVLSVVVLVLVGLTSFVFAADVTVKGGTVYIGNNVFFKALNNAGTGTVDLIKANASDVAVIPDGSELASSAAPTADAGIANKKYVDDSVGSANWMPTSYNGSQSVTFPNGLIFKHGSGTTNGNGGATITFGAAFTTGVVSAQITFGHAHQHYETPQISALSISGMTIVSSVSYPSTTYYWQAWGY